MLTNHSLGRDVTLRAENDMRRGAVAVWLTAPDGDKIITPTNFTLQEVAHGEPCDPLCYIDPRQMQPFVDDLWRAGFRPSKGVASTGQIEATEAHLQTVKGVLDRALAKMWGPVA